MNLCSIRYGTGDTRLRTEHDTVIVVGDSAGAGLALAMTQAVAAAGLGRPDALVLISPWLDGGVDHPDQGLIELSDPALRQEGLRAAARFYAGLVPLEDPRVSPIHGSLEGLPPTLMYAGTRDILVTDARGLNTRAKAVGALVEYHEEEGLFHDWVLLPLAESARAQARIRTFIKAHSKPGAADVSFTADGASWRQG